MSLGTLMRRLARARSAFFAASRDTESFAQVECFFWRPNSGQINFGDHLAHVVIDAMLARRSMHRSEEVAKPARLLSIGSVLHMASTDDVVWGSGVNGKVDVALHRFERLDVRATRGPLTAQFLRKRGIPVPDVFGDPALLLPRLFPGRFAPMRDDGPIFVPNLNDLGNFESPVPVVSPLRGWSYVVSRIVRSRLVLASSLHGLIVAEAFGVPARYVRLSEQEGEFKYLDYYEGTGREGLDAAGSIAAGLEQGGREPPVFSAESLMDAFPYDLWKPPSG